MALAGPSAGYGLQENEGSMAYLLTNVSTLMEAHIAVLHASIHSVYSCLARILFTLHSIQASPL